MLITSLLLFSSLAAASRHGARQRQCVESQPASNGQSSKAEISPSLSSNAIALGSTISLLAVSTSSAAPNTETTVPEPFLLQIQTRDPQSPPGRKRQEPSGSYLEDNSSTIPRCEQGALFQLLNGRLLKEGLVITVSDPPRARPLLEAGASGDISITFSLTDGILSWSNSRFPRQTASFCLLADTVYVYFDATPEGCVDVTLSFKPLYECPGRQALPSSTRSSVGSQLSPGPIPSSRPVSSVNESSGITSRDPGILSFSSTAAGFTSEASPPRTSTIISYSLIATNIPSQTTFGTSSQLTSSQTSLSTSNGAVLPPESSPSFSSALVSSSQSLLSPTPHSTSPDTGFSSPTVPSSQMVPSSQTTSTSTQSSESSSAPAEGLPTSMGLPSLASTLASSWSSPSASDTSSMDLQGAESTTSNSHRGSATYAESTPSSSETSVSTPSVLATSGSEASTSTPSTSETSMSGTRTLSTTPPSSASSEGPTSVTSSTGPLSSFPSSTMSSSTVNSESSTMSSDFTSPVTSSTSYASSTSSTSSSSSSSSSTDATTTSSSSSSGTPTSSPYRFPPGNLLCNPTGPEYQMKFGFKTDTVGSFGYSGQPTGDYISFYVTGSTGISGCPNLGYLYHQRSGLCVTATAPTSSTSYKYTGAGLQLQPCGSSSPTPPEAQAFCSARLTTGFGVGFRGDIVGTSWYGSVTRSNINTPVSLAYASGSYWYVYCS